MKLVSETTACEIMKLQHVQSLHSSKHTSHKQPTYKKKPTRQCQHCKVIPVQVIDTTHTSIRTMEIFLASAVFFLSIWKQEPSDKDEPQLNRHTPVLKQQQRTNSCSVKQYRHPFCCWYLNRMNIKARNNNKLTCSAQAVEDPPFQTSVGVAN